MLAEKSYEPAYVDACQRQVSELLAAYEQACRPDAAPDFEPRLVGALLLALDRQFVHRTRGQEGKDGNPLNEVRMLAASVVADQGVLIADPTIKYRADRSVAGLEVGDPLDLTIERFRALAAAYYDAIRTRFA